MEPLLFFVMSYVSTSLYSPGSVVVAIVKSGGSVLPSSSADTKSIVANSRVQSKTIPHKRLKGSILAE